MPPIVLQQQAAQVTVGATTSVQVGGTLGVVTMSVANPALLDAQLDQTTLALTLTGKQPGSTIITLTDQRGVSATLPVQVAYIAGTIPQALRVRISGDPASPQYVQSAVIAAIRRALTVRSGAQVIISHDDVAIESALAQDNTLDISVPVLIQGEAYFDAVGNVAVHIENIAVPAIHPDILMISDFPEKLTSDGILFSADLRLRRPSRFLYYHYSPPGQPERRIILLAQNRSPEPAMIQFIDGRDGPDLNEMEVGHNATKEFLIHLVGNEGRIIEIPGYGTIVLSNQRITPRATVVNLMQLRVLEGSTIHLTLLAQAADAKPDASPASSKLLVGTHRHARGIYPVPEFHRAVSWSIDDPSLALPIGEIPLPNLMLGQALAGDYGVLESFVVTIRNPSTSPQAIALYENPRGGHATGTYLIDGVLVQSHQVAPFTRFKLRQYIIPAKGFVRVTIESIPEGGSSYPLQLIFGLDDGSVPPGAPGSPVY